MTVRLNFEACFFYLSTPRELSICLVVSLKASAFQIEPISDLLLI
jgi:hypothetical protein